MIRTDPDISVPLPPQLRPDNFKPIPQSWSLLAICCNTPKNNYHNLQISFLLFLWYLFLVSLTITGEIALATFWVPVYDDLEKVVTYQKNLSLYKDLSIKKPTLKSKCPFCNPHQRKYWNNMRIVNINMIINKCDQCEKEFTIFSRKNIIIILFMNKRISVHLYRYHTE